MIDSDIEYDLHMLHNSERLLPEIRAVLLERVIRAVVGDGTALLKRVPAASKDPDAPQSRELLYSLSELVRSRGRLSARTQDGGVAPPAISDDAVLDRIARTFFKHWLGKSLIIILAVSLALIGINVGVMTFQTTDLLEIKAKAETAGEQASLAAQKAKASADESVALINRRFSETKTLEDLAVRTATARITEQGIADLDRAQIGDRAVAAVQAEARRALADTRAQIARQQAQIQRLSQSLGDLQEARTEIARAQGQIKRYEAEAKVWHDTIEGQKETLQNSSLVRMTWSVLSMRGWLIIAATLLSGAAIVLSVFAFRRSR